MRLYYAIGGLALVSIVATVALTLLTLPELGERVAVASPTPAPVQPTPVPSSPPDFEPPFVPPSAEPTPEPTAEPTPEPPVVAVAPSRRVTTSAPTVPAPTCEGPGQGQHRGWDKHGCPDRWVRP